MIFETVAPDIEEYIKNNPEIISLIRTTKENKISAKEISNMEKKFNRNETKALIVAAGFG